jgi:uncharacterized protein (DUF2235 family)
MKKIVICCDGTNNEYGTTNTNVVRLFTALVQDRQQVAYYHPGLGTMGAPGAWTRLSQWFSRLLGQAIGRGLADDISAAYVFLMREYEQGDKVFLFGFSRGAYTVRALAGMLHMFGLIRSGNEPLVPYAIRMLTKLDQHSFEVAANFKATFSRPYDGTWFVGVWDTVNSVGWVRTPLKIPYATNNPDIQIGRHAVSIDERRAFFRQNLWKPAVLPKPSGPKDVKQVWFAGVHSDVGGGYPPDENGLSTITLRWMLQESKNAGLLVDPAKEASVLGEIAADPGAMIHNSLTPAWWIAEFIPKPHWDMRKDPPTKEYRINFWRRRVITQGSLIHSTVLERMKMETKKYHPKLPDKFVVEN